MYEVVSIPSEPGHRFLVNGITVNKFTHTFESVALRDAFSPILPSFEESRICRSRDTSRRAPVSSRFFILSPR
ncbi:hypothetical protein HL667_14170 [Bradyrhizobium sp. 83012]|uniref:Uncharacterized protein n=1 Tax=Bradyrhizobium aeschynomenes TaxID=2734909 RepID=A0ABX2CEQ0_9BRAD|nr:hypothetical protein [Bradyrhizobium aeschynomenes]